MAELETNIPRACPKDCRRCNMAQQLYCVTSLTFNSYEVMSNMLEQLKHIEHDMRMMQGSDNEFLKPETDKPQMPCGGDNRQAIETTLNE